MLCTVKNWKQPKCPPVRDCPWTRLLLLPGTLLTPRSSQGPPQVPESCRGPGLTPSPASLRLCESVFWPRRPAPCRASAVCRVSGSWCRVHGGESADLVRNSVKWAREKQSLYSVIPVGNVGGSGSLCVTAFLVLVSALHGWSGPLSLVLPWQMPLLPHLQVREQYR